MVRYEIGVALPEEIRVNEVPLTVDSPLRSLRAACAALPDRAKWRKEEVL